MFTDLAPEAFLVVDGFAGGRLEEAARNIGRTGVAAKHVLAPMPSDPSWTTFEALVSGFRHRGSGLKSPH